MRVAPLEQNVLFGPHHEEGRAEREHVESLEIDVAAVHDVECTGLGRDLIEDIDVVHAAVRNADECGNVAMQVQQRVHLDGGLVLAESGPGEQRQAEIDGGRVQRIQALIQVYADGIGRVQRSSDADQDLRELGIDSPVMRVIGVGERGPRHAAMKTHVVKLAAQRPQTRFYVAQAFPVSQLRERHRQILVPAGEASRPGIPAVASYTTAELAIWEETHQL